jgi:hypothetical protein
MVTPSRSFVVFAHRPSIFARKEATFFHQVRVGVFSVLYRLQTDVAFRLGVPSRLMVELGTSINM